jgi:hypothetical protein
LYNSFTLAMHPLEMRGVMDPKIILLIVVVAVVVILVAWIAIRKRRTMALRRRFGPEYERTVREHGVARAENVLAAREKRVERFHIRELPRDQREHFVTEWRGVQSRFVDDPAGAVSAADLLVGQLMHARGYPTSDFEQRAADLSVEHPSVVDNYRAAHEIALRHSRNQANTEDLRNAMIYYRSLFENLLHAPTPVETREATRWAS